VAQKNERWAIGLVGDPCSTSALSGCDANLYPWGYTWAHLEAGVYYVLLDSLDATVSAQETVTFDLSPTQSAAPLNDDCAHAEQLTFTANVAVAHGDNTYANNSNAGAAVSGTSCYPDSIYAPDVVYSFTLTQTQDVTITAAAPKSTDSMAVLPLVVALQSVCGAPMAGQELRCQADENIDIVARNLGPGTYYIWVDGQNDGVVGKFDLTVRLSSPTQNIPNDTCASPTTLVPGTPQFLDLTGAKGDYDTTTCNDPQAIGGDAVYAFTLSQPQYVTVTAAPVGQVDPAILEIRAGTCATGTIVDCQTYYDTSVSENLPAGTYYVVVKEPGYVPAQYNVSLTVAPTAPPPSNDSCANATVVPIVALGDSWTGSVDLDLATHDVSSAACNSSDGDQDVFYQVTVPAGLYLDGSVTSGSVDTAFVIYDGTSCTAAAQVQCDNVGSHGSPDWLTYKNETGSPKTLTVAVQNSNQGTHAAPVQLYFDLRDHP
jgi:hypothetical protein